MRYQIMRRDSSAPAAPPSTLQEDWLLRSGQNASSPQPGVVWFHDFRADAEVNAFRWALGFSGGNDPNAASTLGPNVRRITTDGMASGSCLECVNNGTGDNCHWWRPFSPMVGTGNGRGQNDPGANGTITAKAWAPTSGSSTLSNFTTGWYGHPTYANADPTHFDGNDFYLQVVCKMDPRRITGGNASFHVGKFIWVTQAETADSFVPAEHVIWSYGHQGNDGAKNYLQVYAFGVNGLGTTDPLDQEEPGTRIQPGSDSAVDWSYSGGWDVVLLHLRPGTVNTTSGANSTLLEIWAAHEGETSYTKIWSQEYGLSGYPQRNGIQSLILTPYNNGAAFPQPFYHRYAQVIFSKSTIPCPQVWPSASTLPAWASAQSDKTWMQPLTTNTTLFSVAQPVAGGSNTSQGAGICAWSGASAGTYNGHDGLFVWGGGHTDWLGNEVFFIDLVDQKTIIVKARSPETGGDGTQWGDGNPRVPHTYKHVTYSPGFLWCTGQAGSALDGSSFSTVWRLNLATLVWTKVVSDWPGTEASSPDGGSFYSSTRNLIYVVDQVGEVWSFTPGSGAITMSKICSSFPSGANLHQGMAYWDAVGLLLYKSETGVFSALNVDNAGAGWMTLTVSGTFGATQDYPGLVWHPASKKFLAWGHSTNRANIHTLAPSNPAATTYAQAISGTWVASTVAPAAANAIIPPDSPTLDSGAASGTFDRFDLISSFAGSGRDWLILLNSAHTVPNLYRLPAAGV